MCNALIAFFIFYFLFKKLDI